MLLLLCMHEVAMYLAVAARPLAWYCSAIVAVFKLWRFLERGGSQSVAVGGAWTRIKLVRGARRMV